MRSLALLPLLLVAGGAWAQDACTALARTASAPVALPALAPELTAPATQLGAPSGVLAQAFDQAQTVDTVLLHLRIDKCRAAAMSTRPGQFAPGMDPASYKPQTQYDNTPWRFDMNQNGKRMTADEFDAWMKARGVRVAKGAPPVAPAPAPPPRPTRKASKRAADARAGHPVRARARAVQAGLCSRTQAAAWVGDGRVRVNGRVVRDPEFPVRMDIDRVDVEGADARPAPLYIVLNKPRGLVTTVRDEKGRDKTVYRCFDDAGLPWLAPVGRLDKASEGLLLFSNDPQWAAGVTDPERGPEKTYHVQIDRIPEPDLLDALVAGVRTEEGHLAAVRATLVRRGERNAWLEIVLAKPQPPYPSPARSAGRRCAAAGARGDRRRRAGHARQRPVAQPHRR